MESQSMTETIVISREEIHEEMLKSQAELLKEDYIRCSRCALYKVDRVGLVCVSCKEEYNH